ncbi:MAG: hypothetical protein JXM79_03800 [Sedimentisphaerales bacterium]|nr:hypothetical protein [Sedimentisphaerales bacterium]
MPAPRAFLITPSFLTSKRFTNETLGRVFWTKDISFPCPLSPMGKEKKWAGGAVGISRERRDRKDHATKRSDWRGLCCPEPRRFDGTP